jgi:hypothetical protein
LNKIIHSDGAIIGYDFRRSHSKLGFEYRLMDFCGLECIRKIIQFIFLLLKLLNNDIIKKTSCKAYNNVIVNKQIMRVFTTDKTINADYNELIRECTRLPITQTDLTKCFDEIFTHLNNMAFNEKYINVFQKLELKVDKM